MRTRSYPIFKGNLRINSWENEDEEFGEKWRQVGIHGDPEALRSLAEVLIAIADCDQEDLPDGAREHVHLDSDWELSADSESLVLGRLDAKGSGEFPNGFKPSKKLGRRPVC